jgi:tetratricopeptide (TPR) repeat protein
VRITAIERARVMFRILLCLITLFFAVHPLVPHLWCEQSTLDPSLSTAEELIQKGDFSAAVPICLNVIHHDPHSADAQVLLGIAYAGLHKNEDAIAALRRAIQLRPSSLSAHVNLGIAYMQSQRAQVAITEFENAVALGDQSWSTSYNLALCYSATGDLERAKALLLKVVSLAPDRSEPRLSLASVYFDLSNQSGALNEIQTAESLAPTDWALRGQIAALLFKHAVYESAIQELELVVSHNGEDDSARLQLAQAHLKLKHYHDVLRVLSSPPGPTLDNQRAALAHSLLATAYSESGNNMSAIEHCQEALRLDRKPAYYAELSKVLLKAGAMEDALELARKAIKQFPDSVDVLRAMASAAAANGVNEDAVQALKSIIRLSPEDQDAYLGLGNLYLNSGNFDLAEKTYLTMGKLFPKSADPYFGLALVQIRQDRLSKARELLDKVIQTNPNHAGALYYFGKILYEEGQFQQALECLRRSAANATVYDDLTSVHYQIARCYLRLGETGKAQEEFAIYKKLADQRPPVGNAALR